MKVSRMKEKKPIEWKPVPSPPAKIEALLILDKDSSKTEIKPPP